MIFSGSLNSLLCHTLCHPNTQCTMISIKAEDNLLVCIPTAADLNPPVSTESYRPFLKTLHFQIAYSSLPYPPASPLGTECTNLIQNTRALVRAISAITMNYHECS